MIRVRGTELHVESAGDGLAVLWGHGLSSSSAQDAEAALVRWDRVVDAGHRVVRWDARGHGRSAGAAEPDQYRWDELARDLLALADALGIERFVAGGVSMGAAIALHAATLAPHRVLGLVLGLAPTAYETRPAQAALYRAGAELVERAGIDAYVAALDEGPLPEILRPVAHLYRNAPDVLAELLPSVLRGAAASDLPPPDAVAGLMQPALLLAWDTDPGHPVSSSERITALLDGQVELHIARRLRDVAPWTDHVIAFLDGLAGGTGKPTGTATPTTP